ncbi:MAG: response regulator [Treponema sp.]|jgi:PAS domain S-box-containing protein|nr:response regulator [Treponema sp.]
MQKKLEQCLGLMLEYSPDIIIFLDKEGRCVLCSKTFLTLLGRTDDTDIKGCSFASLYATFGDRAFVEQSAERFEAIKAGHKATTDNVSIDFSGTGRVRQYSINSTPIMDEAGNFDGALVLYRDITDLLRAEADERTAVMLNATPLACTFWDAEGNLQDCNQEALHLFEITSKEELQARFYELSGEDDTVSRDQVREHIHHAYQTGKMVFEWMHRTASGAPLPTEVTLVQVAWRDDYRVVGYTRDLRELKAQEEQMRETDERNRELEVQTRAAQVASQSKSKFLASMSHEIRTPMNAIIGMSEIMRTDNLDETQRRFLGDIKKMSRSLLQIINDILDISKIEAGKLTLVPVHFNMMEWYDHICSLSRFIAEAKDLEWRQSFSLSVPPVIYGDDVRMRQVVINLINNAVKYTKAGYVDFEVGRAIKQDRDYLIFRIQDTGIGIQEKDFPKLFGTFQQLDGESNRGIQGTGLGLAITKNLVTMMQGTIEFDSNYGIGSVFTVYLPLIEGDSKQVEKKDADSKVWASDELECLVVDDNQINLTVALAFLALHHINADTAVSGKEALQKVQEKRYDLVFMDHMMPEMDGIETVRRIRLLDDEWLKTMPIIALSANALSGAQERFLAAGMNDFIAKPIDAEELNRKLAIWLPLEKTSHVEAPKPAPGNVVREPALFDQQAGLHNIGGNEGLYWRILNIFRKEHSRDVQKIRDALEMEDQVLAHRLAHTLKSSAGLLGSERVKQSAQVIEKALAENRWAEAQAGLPQLEEDMDALLHVLGPVDESPVPAREPALPGSGVPNQYMLLDLIATLRPLLETGNTDSLNYIDAIKVALRGGPVASHLIQQIEDFEFNGALETLLHIKESFA